MLQVHQIQDVVLVDPASEQASMLFISNREFMIACNNSIMAVNSYILTGFFTIWTATGRYKNHRPLALQKEAYQSSQ